jgi:hypothetical protein
MRRLPIVLPYHLFYLIGREEILKEVGYVRLGKYTNTLYFGRRLLYRKAERESRKRIGCRDRRHNERESRIVKIKPIEESSS